MKEIVLGFVMGAANLLPGISGGTIMFISGRYSEIIDAAASVFTLRFEKRKVFLLVYLGLGIVLAFVALSKLLDFLYANFPVEVTSFFAGLIMGGLFFMSVGMRPKLKESVAIALGALAMVGIALANEGSLSPTFLNLFVGGVIAGATMILPGISGSSMLLILGLYDDAVHAVANLEFGRLFSIGIGAFLGIILMTIGMKKLVERFESITMAFLFGLTLAGLIFILSGGASISFIIFGFGTTFLLQRIVG